MKRLMWISILCFVLLMSFGMDVQAQSKEVTEAVTCTFYVTPKILPLDEGRIGMNYESVGICLSDTGSGLFHGTTVHGLGGNTLEKGKFKDERGWGVYTLQNGDKVFSAVTAAGEVTREGVGEGKVTSTITGGTGKYAGIKGSVTLTRYGLRPAIEGIAQSYSKGTIKYTLP